MVLGYRNVRKTERLAKRADGRLRVVDAQTAYFRLKPPEYEPLALYAALKPLF